MNTLFWLGALVLFSVGEAITVGLTSIWFAVGALGALMAALLGGGLWLQVAVFLVLSALSLALVRPLARRFLQPHYAPTNADRVIGQSALVCEDIDDLAGKGQVSIAGQVWTARSVDGTSIPAGTEVVVQSIQGVKVLVQRAETTADK